MIANGSIVAIAAMLSVPAAACAGDLGAVKTMKPMNAVSTDFGMRHYVSFFTRTDGRCDLTVMSGDRFDETSSKAPGGVERWRLTILPGSTRLMEARCNSAARLTCRA